jgi:hypothetical protein
LVLVSASSETTLERLSAVLPKQSSTNPQLCSPGASAGVRGGTRAQYANEPVAAPEFRTDEIAVRAECFAQGGDLNLEVLVRHNNVRPHPVEELLLRDERAVGLQQDQEEVERASTNLDRNTAGATACGNGRIRLLPRRRPNSTKLRDAVPGFCATGPALNKDLCSLQPTRLGLWLP